jgi:DAACS family dicarboxylate/amino acid:cation (Na+ or H+) symporter
MISKSPGYVTRSILLAMFLGLITGHLLGPGAMPLGVVGKFYIQLIKAIAIPLVLFSIVEAVVATDLSWRTARLWLLVIVINTACALSLGLGLSNLFRPGDGFAGTAAKAVETVPRMTKEFSLASFFNSFVPESVVAPFVENNVLSVVFISVLVGAALRSYLQRESSVAASSAVERALKAATSIIGIILVWLVQLVPVAVFCVTARTVGEHGFAPFKGLLLYVLLGCFGMLLQMVLIYPLWIRVVGRYALRDVWRAARKPIVYAFGTNSSLATLPVTLNALDDLNVPKSASRLGTCIGTNFNNDGIILYEAMAVLFVAQAMNIDLSLGEQVFAALMSLAAAIGVAGVPEAGVVSLSLVLSAVGLPLEILPILLTVDWIVARMRSVTNVMSDMTVSIAIAGLDRTGRSAS